MSAFSFIGSRERWETDMDTNFTTQPVAADWGIDPEFIDLPGLKSRFAIGRSAAYTHIENGDFRSVVLRRKGCIKGRRLVDVQSVRDWIEKQLAKQESGEVEKVDPALSAICKEANKASLKAKREKAKREKAKTKPRKETEK
jgi:hypothetical protein